MSLLRGLRSSMERGVTGFTLLLAATALAPALAEAQTYTLGGRVDYAAGTGVQGLAIWDLNRDGVKDLVTSNYGSDDVSVLIGIAGGGYLPQVTYPVGDRPYSVVVTDFNNDILVDLLVCNAGTHNVSVLLGNGNGTFAPRTDFATGLQPFVARTGDFNEDGNRDIVSANSDGDNISILLGNGAGGFAPAVNYAAGNAPSCVAVGDFDWDGHRDLVVTNYFSNSISIFRGNGDGTFQPRVDTANGAGTNPNTCVLAYLDDDNILDLAVVNGGPNTVSVRMGNGTGGFGAKVDYATGTSPVTVAAADLNVDGRVDLLTADQGGNNISRLLNAGGGTFPTRSTTAVGGGPFSLVVTDLTGDGEPDVVTGNYFTNNVSVLSGSVPGGFRVDQQAPNLTAPDQNGVSRSLSTYLGKWVLLDICTSWCPPCNAMATEAQQVFDTWVGHPSVQFEYLSCLVEGPSGAPAVQGDAQDWAGRHGVTRPVLHASGLLQAPVRAYYEAIGTNAFPSVLIIDPTGKIVYRKAGALSGQMTVDKIAELAGVAAPTLVPPPPPPPPPGIAPVTQRAMTGSTIQISYGASNWSGPLTLGSSSEDLRGSELVGSGVSGVPGIPGDSWMGANALVGDDGIERVDLYVGTLDELQTILWAQPWQVKLSNLTWPDGAPRELHTSTAPVVSVFYYDAELNYSPYLETPIEAHVTWNGTTLEISPLAIGNFAQLPPTTNGFAISGLAFRRVGAVDAPAGPLSTRLELATPFPNPAHQAANVRWSMPRTADATLAVYDVSGRQVARLHEGRAAAGAHTARWDLEDDDGTRVGPGIYFVRFTSGEEERTTRLVVVNR